MAHTSSAKKRIRVTLKARIRNKPIRTKSKTYVIKANKLIQAGNFDVAEEAVKQAISILDKTAQKGIIHPNNAARRKSHLVKSLNKARAPRAEG